jgi:hypothetical protein
MTNVIVRALCALLNALFPPTGQRRRTEPDHIPPVRSPEPCLPRHKSRQAADTGPLPATGTTRRYAPAVWHIPQECAAGRLTQGRRRAELWLATHGLDAPWPVRPHGVTLGGMTGPFR